MAKAIISREARQYVIDQLREQGTFTRSDVVELIRPHCAFDPELLQEQKLGRLAGSIIRSIRDEQGTRTAFLIRNADTIVHIETCRDLQKVTAVEQQLLEQLNGLKASHRKALARKQELEGQMSLFRRDAAV